MGPQVNNIAMGVASPVMFYRRIMQLSKGHQIKGDTLGTGISPFSDIKGLLTDKPMRLQGIPQRIPSYDTMSIPHIAENSEAFQFLHDPEEDLYGPDDGQPL
jgi:hypothetical protein